MFSACSGLIDDPLANGTGAGPDSFNGSTSAKTNALRDPGTKPVHLLTPFEIQNTLEDVFGLTQPPTDTLPKPSASKGFDNIASAATISPAFFSAFQTLTKGVVDGVLGHDGAPRNGSAPWVGCPAATTAGAENEGCARTAVRDLGRLLWRRPLTDDELTGIMTLFSDDNVTSFTEGLRQTFLALLWSPNFLYRIETPANPGETRSLDGYEVASAMSFFLWKSTPDETLLSAAENGSLNTDSGLDAQLDRMLADERATRFIRSFSEQLFHTTALEGKTVDPSIGTLSSQLIASMQREVPAFFQALFDEDRPITDILLGDWTMVDDNLALHYGMTPTGSTAFRRADLDYPAGLLRSAALLTVTSIPTRTSPVKRGEWVLERLLCDKPPPPPPGVEGTLEESVSVSGTIREQMAAHRADPSCAACHSVMDPIGLGFENFDPIGRWRDMEDDQPVDATGEFPVQSGFNGESFDGLLELSQILANNPRFNQCMTKKMLTFAMGRSVTGRDDMWVDEITTATAAGGNTLKALTRSIIKSEIFRFRSTEEAGQ